MKGWLTSAFLLASIASARAENISGQWQGTLHAPGQDRRLVVKIQDVAGKLRAQAYDLDEEPVALPVSKLQHKGTKIAFNIDLLGASFLGDLSADGRNLSGQLMQGKILPLGLQRAAGAAAWVIDPSPHRISFITVEKGVSLEVLDWGGSGRPLLFLTGLGASAHVFDQFALKFTANHHVYGVTRRGYGASSAPAPGPTNYSADRLGDDVATIIDMLKLDRPVLVGHSVAGSELSTMANHHAGKISGLIYLDAGYSYAFYAPGGVVPFGVSLMLDAKDLNADQPADITPTAASIAKFQALLGNYQADVTAAQQFLGKISSLDSGPDNPTTVAQRRRQEIADAIVAGAEKFTSIPVPVLAFFATEPKLPPSLPAAARADATAIADAQAHQADAFAAGVPSAHVIRLPGAIHRVWVSDETKIIQEMNAFMASLP